MKKLLLSLILFLFASCNVSNQNLEHSFQNPPDSVKPWVFWFWINGNISKEGITKDLEAMKRVGIGGVLWMEVSGPWWAPQGKVEAGTEEWNEAMQWAISEADRLGLDFDLSVDFGYGSGGPYITPDLSMQELVWSETQIKGGKQISTLLEKPIVDYRPNLKAAWMNPGQTMNPVVTKALKEIDSYRDVAVLAYPSSLDKTPRIAPLIDFDGRGWKTHLPSLDENTNLVPVNRKDIIDLTDRMQNDGRLEWNAPKGNWTIIRLGYASNFKMTRPCPITAVGLECDRLNKRGIDTHFEHRLKPILEAAGDKAGRTLQYIHIDSWEAHGQNWTKDFEKEFQARRGYDIHPWLLVLTGQAVESREKTDRFLWDLRQTVSKVIPANYINRLKELIKSYGVQFSCEPYGRLCVNTLDYASKSDFPICEFWTERDIINPFPTFSKYWYTSMKGLASIANTYGKNRVGAEAFTGCRGWVDHPYLIKAMGDEAFCNGVSHYIIHLSAHQAYDNMVPGLTHRKWGQHFNRHQTWWEFSKPYFNYVSRCQFLLQQGRRVVDVACLYHEGAPLNFNDMEFELPFGYDFDFCTSEIIQQMSVKQGRIYLPTGVSYKYLALPRSGKLTLPAALKIQELKEQGALIYLQSPITGTPGLEGYPESDTRVKNLADSWPLLPKDGWKTVFAGDKIDPDFKGDDLMWIHRHTKETDLYFIANTKQEPVKRECTFRITGRKPELWNAETGEIFNLPNVQQNKNNTTIPLQFNPAQSWFVVFREKPTVNKSQKNPFSTWQLVQEIKSTWQLSFDPNWGTQDTLTLDNLKSWSEFSDPLVKYYSGTANYKTEFDFADTVKLNSTAQFCLDFKNVQVMARVTLNGKDCGITWKPPYRVDISNALIPGKNNLEIAVVNTWVNRMIGDEQLPLDADWKDWETLYRWPAWFKNGQKSPAGRYTFTSGRHYTKDSPLMPSGLIGPVRILNGY